MDRTNARLDALEGRLIAHRRVLTRLVALLPPDRRAQLLDWIEQREVMPDGQEDPGAADLETAALELALSDEMRQIHAAIAPRPDTETP